MNTTKIEFEPRDKILLVTSWTKIMTSQSSFQSNFILRRPGEASSGDIIKFPIMLKSSLYRYKKGIKKRYTVSFINSLKHTIFIFYTFCRTHTMITVDYEDNVRFVESTKLQMSDEPSKWHTSCFQFKIYD